MTRPKYSDTARFPVTVGVPLKVANECGTRSRKMVIRSEKDSVPEALIEWMSTHRHYKHLFAEADPDDLTVLSGVGEGVQDALRAAGYSTYDAIARSNMAELSEVNGVSPHKALSIMAQAAGLAEK